MGTMPPLRVVGLMSGTSADGIDVAIVDVDLESGEVPRLVLFRTVPFSERGDGFVRNMLNLSTAAADADAEPPLAPGPAASRRMCRLEFRLAEEFARAAAEVVAEAGRLGERGPDLVASHGQTAWHDVDPGTGRVGSTLQVGDGSVIAERLGVTTVCDFRVADVAAGGQGAPLVSVFDHVFERAPAGGKWRAVANIGGISNVTLLPPRGVQGRAVAFDSGPGNALIDWAASQATGGGQRMDEGGRIAAGSRVCEPLLSAMEDAASEYLQRPPPKTTGRELFSVEFARRFLGSAPPGWTPGDMVATATEFTARTLAASVLRYADAPVAELAVNGGGSRNPELMRRLALHVGGAVRVYAAGAPGGPPPTVRPDAKEAVVFAYLGALCVTGRTGNVPSCTGAAGERVLGKICPGENYSDLMRRIWGAQSNSSTSNGSASGRLS